MHAKVTQITRYTTPSTIMRLNYVKDARILLISEAAMFGFDWTGKARVIPECEIYEQINTGGFKEYTKSAWNSVEFEHGVCSTEYFALPNGVFYGIYGE